MFSLTMNSTHDARLVNFHQIEHFSGITFRWTEAVSMIRIALPSVNARVAIDTGCLRGDRLDFPFRIYWNDFEVPRKAIRIERGVLSFDVSNSLCEPAGEQRLTISCKPLKAENGRRKLGMPVCSVRVEPRETALGKSDTEYPVYQPVKPLRDRIPFAKKTAAPPTVPLWRIKFPEPSRESTPSYDHPKPVTGYDRVVVSTCEINSRHGTGILIQHLFQDLDRVATINSYQCYNDERTPSGTHYCLDDHRNLNRHDIYRQLMSWFDHSPPKEAYIVPNFASDFHIATGLKDLFGTKICLHVMDDSCLYGDVSVELVQKAIEMADLVFVISPEMQDAYQQQFGRKMSLLPPIVPDQHIPAKPVPWLTQSPVAEPSRSLWNGIRQRLSLSARDSECDNSLLRGVLIGNVWDEAWLQRLCKTIKESGLQIDWFANDPDLVRLQISTEALAECGLQLHDALWGEELVQELRRRPFAIMPSGTFSSDSKNEGIARLSLPSRVPFMIATANLPIIAIGGHDTAASAFLSRFGLGMTVNYDGFELKQAVDSITRSGEQQRIRSHAFNVGHRFSNRDLASWLWDSLQNGTPVDQRFEELFEVRSLNGRKAA